MPPIWSTLAAVSTAAGTAIGGEGVAHAPPARHGQRVRAGERRAAANVAITIAASAIAARIHPTG